MTASAGGAQKWLFSVWAVELLASTPSMGAIVEASVGHTGTISSSSANAGTQVEWSQDYNRETRGPFVTEVTILMWWTHCICRATHLVCSLESQTVRKKKAKQKQFYQVFIYTAPLDKREVKGSVWF